MNRRQRRATKVGAPQPINVGFQVIEAKFRQAAENHMAGRLYEAEVAYREILFIDPNHAHALSLLGVIATQANELEDAVKLLTRAIEINDKMAPYHSSLGDALFQLGRTDEAVASFKKAIRLMPDFAGASNNLVVALNSQGKHDEAIHVAKRALMINPDHSELLNNLGNALQYSGRLGKAIEVYRRLTVLTPGLPVPHHNLGTVLADAGLVEEGINHIQESQRLDLKLVAAADMVVFSHLYMPGVTLKKILDLSIAWAQEYGQGDWGFEFTKHDGPPRIGFLSGDLRNHAVGFLAVPVLEELKNQGVDFTVYYNNVLADEISERIKHAAASWRTVMLISDEELARTIHADGIDILIEMSGHTAGNRLQVPARRAAPIQIASWLGCPCTSGLDNMDYFLADSAYIDKDAEKYYSESIVRLPHAYTVFEPWPDAPEIPFRPDTSPFTFGSFNVLKKITPEVLSVWRMILEKVPSARFVMKANGLECPDTRARYIAGLGVDPERLTMMGGSGRKAHLEAMGGCDVALDTFPYSGGQTTLECLWMGLPVITLPGDTFASRHSLSYLSAIDLDYLASGNVDEYVRTACYLSRSRDLVYRLRDQMRKRMVESPLCDRASFVGHFMTAMNVMWLRYKADLPRQGIDIAGAVNHG